MTATQSTLDLGLPKVDTDDARTAWWNTAWAAIADEAAKGEPFTIYEAARRHSVPEPDHPNRWGALTSAMRRDEAITPVGFAIGSRRTVAKSAVRLWVGAGQGVAA